MDNGHQEWYDEARYVLNRTHKVTWDLPEVSIVLGANG